MMFHVFSVVEDVVSCPDCRHDPQHYDRTGNHYCPTCWGWGTLPVCVPDPLEIEEYFSSLDVLADAMPAMTEV